MFDTLDALTGELQGLDVSGFDAPAVQAGVTALGRARGALDAVEARLVARADALSNVGKGASGREALGRSGTMSSRQTRQIAERAKVLESAPALSDALARAEAGAAHVDAAARACANLDEDQRQALLDDPVVVAAACRMPVEGFAKFVKTRADSLIDEQVELDRFERQRAATKLSKWKRSDGMHVINIELDPETGSRTFRAIDAKTESIAQRDGLPKTDHTAALAFVELIRDGADAGPSPNPTPPEIILIDAATASTGRHRDSVAETSSGVALPVETIKRVGCEAVVDLELLDRATGVVLDAGRTSRVATRAQRRALRAMYPTCSFPGCDRCFDWCQIHHIVAWERGGSTDLHNLLPLCSHHHHLVHEGGWRLRLGDDRTLTIHQRDGTGYATVPLPSVELAKALHRKRKRRHPRPTGSCNATHEPDQPDHSHRRKDGRAAGAALPDETRRSRGVDRR